ncbi:ARMT1-like domain-containing protein [Desulfobacula sp.]|uniref:damage-control phosphatase ARMT1 family protein n=1 Tax=Desulfobacula sp. TaxID=2593537 RepID=UPI002617ED7C|nr:ARMT1-like domain-containing protein [Desulfobacula sp.]
MKVEEECIPCILQMSLNGLRSLNLEPDKQRTIYHEFVKSIMTQNNIWDITSAELVEKVLIILMDKTAIADPFITIKEKANSQLLSIYDKLKHHVSNCDDPILMATQLSIFGNTIDVMLSGNPENNLKKVLMASTKDIPLHTESYQQLSSQLKNSKSLLVIADNAGEAVLDKLLIETLYETYHMEMYYAVRENPALNDVTYDEAVDMGLPDIAQVITNGIDGPLPGTVLSRCSEKFLHVLNSVDMVIVKGGGNFESLIGEPNLPLNTFFLLMCKCEVHSRFFNTPVGQAIIWVN